MSDLLTIQEAAQTTGWSARMLRYVERIGLIEPTRSESGYRLYGAAELQRLRTLRDLLGGHDIGLSDVGFALRLRQDDELRMAVDTWLDAVPGPPQGVPAADWLAWEQDKHARLLASASTGRHQEPSRNPGTCVTGSRPTGSITSPSPRQFTLKESEWR